MCTHDCIQMIVHTSAYTKQQIHSDIPNKKKGISRTKHCSATDTDSWDTQLVQTQHLGPEFIFPTAGSRTQQAGGGAGGVLHLQQCCLLPASFPISGPYR